MEDDTNPIHFYSLRTKWGMFSNFFRGKIVLKGKEWPTAEHYFQAQKFAGTSHEERIRLLKSPAEAKAEGNKRTLPLRKDWSQVKDQVMYDVVLAKFTQRPVLRQKLLESGTRELVEHTRNDSYWGDGGDGSGQNKLGKILMQVRKELATEDEDAQDSEESAEPPRKKLKTVQAAVNEHTEQK